MKYFVLSVKCDGIQLVKAESMEVSSQNFHFALAEGSLTLPLADINFWEECHSQGEAELVMEEFSRDQGGNHIPQ